MNCEFSKHELNHVGICFEIQKYVHVTLFRWYLHRSSVKPFTNLIFHAISYWRVIYILKKSLLTPGIFQKIFIMERKIEKNILFYVVKMIGSSHNLVTKALPCEVLWRIERLFTKRRLESVISSNVIFKCHMEVIPPWLLTSGRYIRWESRQLSIRVIIVTTLQLEWVI